MLSPAGPAPTTTIILGVHLRPATPRHVRSPALVWSISDPTTAPLVAWRAAKLVSVIVPALNAAATIESQLAALSNQRYAGDYEVVLADNGSTDHTIEIACTWGRRLPSLRLIDASAQRGAAFARNRGVQAAAGDLLAFCESDDQVDHGWLAALAESASHHDMVGGRIDIVALNTSAVRLWRNWNPPTDRLPVKNHFLPFAIGANCALWRDVLDAVGGWNESYSAQTDVELSWRVQLASYQLGFAPAAVVYYRLRDSRCALARQSYQIGRIDARLDQDFRRRGAPPVAARQAIGGWLSLGWRGPKLVRAGALSGALLHHHAWLAGRVAGRLGRTG